MTRPTRVALITGANSGIGLATTELFLQSDLKVVAHARKNKASLDQLKHKNLSIVCADLGCEKDISVFLNSIGRHGIDIVVNNAAHFNARKDFSQISIDELAHIYRVNLFSPLQIIQQLLPPMIAQSWGRIVNISSVSVAHGGSAATLDYTSSKSSLEAITKSLAKEYSKFNILINSIRVGYTDTKFHLLNPSKRKKPRIQKIPLGRPAHAEEIAQVIKFLCTEASSFVSGAVLPATGGE